MRPCKLLQQFGVTAVFLSASFISLEKQCEAVIQQGAQQSQQQGPPSEGSTQTVAQAAALSTEAAQASTKQRKIWTNEEVIALRTPADIYLLEKEAKEAAEAAAAAAKEAADRDAAKTAATQPPGIKLPETQEETEKMLKDNESNLQEQSTVLERLQNELANTPRDEQADKQKEIDRLTESLTKLKQDGKALEDHLKTLSEKLPTENPPSTPQPPSS